MEQKIVKEEIKLPDINEHKVTPSQPFDDEPNVQEEYKEVTPEVPII